MEVFPEAPEDGFGTLLGAFLGYLLCYRLEVRGAGENVLEMSPSRFQNHPLGISKNKQNARDILEKRMIRKTGQKHSLELVPGPLFHASGGFQRAIKRVPIMFFFVSTF